MKRLLLFLVCFLTSTGLVAYLCGGFSAPAKPEDEAPSTAEAEAEADTDRAPRDTKLHPLLNADARGVYIGTVEGGELHRFEEIIHDDGTVEHIPRVVFRYESAEPSSSKLGVVRDLAGTFFSNEGRETAYVTSDTGSVRLDEKTDQVSEIQLRGNVAFEERDGDDQLGFLGTPSLEIRFVPVEPDAATPAPGKGADQGEGDAAAVATTTRSDRPVLSSQDRVTIRKDGLWLEGTGFHGDTKLRDFRLERDVVLDVEDGAGLAMPDMLGSDDASDGPPMRIESADALILRGGADEDSSDTAGASDSWGVSDATVHFVGATTLTQGAQVFEVGALEIGLRSSPESSEADRGDPDAKTGKAGATAGLQAYRMQARNGVVFRDGDLELTAEVLDWNDAEEPPVLVLSGNPSIRLRQESDTSLFRPDGGAEGDATDAGLVSVRCADRIELRTDLETGTRVVHCFEDVQIQEGRSFDDDRPGLAAERVVLTIDESGDAARLDQMLALGTVQIRDPEFLLTGGRFELQRKGQSEDFDLVMSEDPELRLAGESIDGFRMDLLPGSDGTPSDDDPDESTATDEPAVPAMIVARAVDRIVVSRETETTTLIDFIGGFSMQRIVEETTVGSIRSESMLLSMQKADDGQSRLASWNATGDVHYESPEGTADGDHLSYAKAEGRVRLLGTRGGHRAILRFANPDGGDPQLLLAESFVYVPDTEAFSAEGRVEGDFTTDTLGWEGLGARDDDNAEDDTAAPRTVVEDDDAEPERWKLFCDAADVSMRRDDETTSVTNHDTTADGAETPARPRIAYFDARGNVRLNGNSQRVRADQVTYSAPKQSVILRGDDARPAVLSTRDPDVEAEEWSSIASTWFDIDTAREIVRCEDGGEVTFWVEDLLTRDGGARAERLMTTIRCAGLMKFHRDRDASFYDRVRVTQVGATDTVDRPRTSLECEYLHVVFDPAAPDEERTASRRTGTGSLPTDSVRLRKLTCEGKVVVRHKDPSLVASGEYLALVTRETMIYLHGADGNVYFRHENGTYEPKSLRYDYEAGKVEVWQFNFVPSRGAGDERN